MTNSNVFDILEVFEKSNNILFPIDMRIDFDAFCSAFIIKEFFKIKYNKNLTFTYSGKISDTFKKDFTEFANFNELNVQEETDPNNIDYSKYDLIITADTNSEAKASVVNKSFTFPKDKIIVNFDHHPDNSYFGTYNFVHFHASCVTVLHKFFQEINFETPEIVDKLIIIGFLTDSGVFKYDLVNSDNLRLIADLLDKHNWRLFDFIHALTYKESIASIKAKQITFKNLVIELNEKIAYSFLTLKDFSDYNLDPYFSLETSPADLINKIEGTIVTFHLREKPTGVADFTFTISLRSRDVNLNVNEIAKNHFRGGGHPLASGGVIPSEITDINEAIEYTKNVLKEYIK